MLRVNVIRGNLAVKLDTTQSKIETCPVCSGEVNPSLGYCEKCINQYLENFKRELEYLIEDHPDIKLIPKGPNILIRHKYGEEIYL